MLPRSFMELTLIMLIANQGKNPPAFLAIRISPQVFLTFRI